MTLPGNFHDDEHVVADRTRMTANGIIYQWRKFLVWCDEQEVNRMAWLAISLFLHGCILFPMTVTVNGMAGNSIPLLMISIAALMIMFTANLSQLPERIILPCVFLSVLIDLVVMGICLFHGIHVGLLFQH